MPEQHRNVPLIRTRRRRRIDRRRPVARAVGLRAVGFSGRGQGNTVEPRPEQPAGTAVIVNDLCEVSIDADLTPGKRAARKIMKAPNPDARRARGRARGSVRTVRSLIPQRAAARRAGPSLARIAARNRLRPCA
jgi:hypothetical protein